MLTEPAQPAQARARSALGDQLLAVLDAIADGITVQDAAGTLVHANAAAAELTGFATPQELLHADPAAIAARLEILDEHGTKVSLAERPGEGVLEQLLRFRVRATGVERWVSVRSRPMRDGTTERYAVNTFRDVTDTIAAQRDITDQRLAEDMAARAIAAEAETKAAHRARAKLAAILDGITDPFSVLDRELRVVHVNEAGARLIGTTPAEMIGRRAWDVVPEARDTPFYRAYQQVLSTGRPITIEEFFPPWDRWYEASIYPLEDGLAVYTRDVTVRKRAIEMTSRLARYAALRADISGVLSEERDINRMLQRTCEALVDHLEVAFARVWTLDEARDTLFLQASAGMYTHLNGKHKAVAVGKHKIGRIAASRKPHLSNDVQHDPQIGDPAWAASERMVAFAGYPLMIDGRVIGVLAMFSRRELAEDTTSALANISDLIAQGITRRRAEIELEHRAEDLARSNAELEQFAYVASHDLQEPLRMVASYNQLLARRYKGKLGQDADEFIGFTVEGVTRMQRLINDLLAYSRVGRRSYEKTEVELEDVYVDVIANLEQAISENAAVITHDPLPRVIADASQMIQLLQNLIGNAIKFHGDEPPRIHIGVREERDQYTLSVRDNGIGIDPQYFERIFVIFQRLNAREKYPGTGIGLAICKKIVERHGGTIWVESAPGTGSTVLFTIPRPSRRAS